MMKRRRRILATKRRAKRRKKKNKKTKDKSICNAKSKTCDDHKKMSTRLYVISRGARGGMGGQGPALR